MGRVGYGPSLLWAEMSSYLSGHICLPMNMLSLILARKDRGKTDLCSKVYIE